MRSAEKTRVAILLPLILGAAGLGHRHPWAHTPSSCLHPPLVLLLYPALALRLPKLLFINTDQNILLPAETPCRQHTPTRCWPLPKLRSHTHPHPLLPTQLFPAAWNRALRLTHSFAEGFSPVYSRQSLTLVNKASITLCPLTWGVSLIT